MCKVVTNEMTGRQISRSETRDRVWEGQRPMSDVYLPLPISISLMALNVRPTRRQSGLQVDTFLFIDILTIIPY